MSPEAIDRIFESAGTGVLGWAQLTETAEHLIATEQRQQAIDLYRLWLAKTESPLAYVICFNLGVALVDANALTDAERAYRQAIGLKPDFVQAHMNLGTLLERQGRRDEALAQWRFILRFADYDLPADKALYVMALNNLGRLLEVVGEYREAERMLERSIHLDRSQPAVLQHWVHLRQKQCEWPIYKALDGVTQQEMRMATSPLAMLSASDDPIEQLDAARRFVRTRVRSEVAPLSALEGYRHDRLRIGYCSSDFCLHPVGLLMAELFELHDRRHFDIYGFCWSPEDGSSLRKRIIGAMDHFIRIADLNDEAAAHCIRSHEIDILIDLQGLTAGARPNVLAYRPAPVQVAYLGFPATTALPCIDYVIADRYVLPENLAGSFTETPVYLPRVFQVSDSCRPLGITPTRAACGLPEDGFVYCCFNNNHKFTPEVFSAWMNILRQAPRSVLWLLADNPWARQNLMLQADRQGVARERLVFAERALPADYLARYRLADLFLDTFPFNAGTTANDALWMGIPVLTCSGKSFASRMAGSLLKSVGLPELVAENLADYERSAIRLGLDGARVREYKRHLASLREAGRLFDTGQFVEELETAYRQLRLSPP